MSLSTADQPGDMQYRRCSIGAVLTMVLLYCTIVVSKRSRDSVPEDVFVSQTRGGITCGNYAQLGAALSHKKGKATG